MKKSSKRHETYFNGPLLDTLTTHFSASLDYTSSPLCLPIIKNLKTIEFPTKVTFFVGENGSGKSTLLEALASYPHSDHLFVRLLSPYQNFV